MIFACHKSQCATAALHRLSIISVGISLGASKYDLWYFNFRFAILIIIIIKIINYQTADYYYKEWIIICRVAILIVVDWNFKLRLTFLSMVEASNVWCVLSFCQ